MILSILTKAYLLQDIYRIYFYAHITKYHILVWYINTFNLTPSNTCIFGSHTLAKYEWDCDLKPPTPLWTANTCNSCPTVEVIRPHLNRQSCPYLIRIEFSVVSTTSTLNQAYIMYYNYCINIIHILSHDLISNCKLIY